ncbi:aminodeoxychorismate/anthranilate synthase component II [Rhodospirillaceae bacterium SYSU D60014]|uniref:anthranilate synthase component II n=1 Tax=Virgifigura deserti TaxID=2268457 RepID=UPI000E66A3F4
MTVLLIDNYDSFAHNLARYIRELGRPCAVARNDAVTLADIARLAPSHIIVSPGPCTPKEAGISNAVIAQFGSSVPLLGVCLGHQCIGHVFGGRVVRAMRPMHGKTTSLRHDGSGVFAGLPSPFRVTRYHSLVVAAEDLPDCLAPTAFSEEGEIMALRHRRAPIFGVQFHPEAVLTEHGHALLENFLRIGTAQQQQGDAA